MSSCGSLLEKERRDTERMGIEEKKENDEKKNERDDDEDDEKKKIPSQ
jgi:hypothetical protein